VAEPWIPGGAEAAPDARRHAPAALRNRDAILAVLAEELPADGTVLEVASGSGEHAVHFAAALQRLRWQPSDPDDDALASVDAWVAATGVSNVAPALKLDAGASQWPALEADAIFCANMVHIAPWQAAQGLFAWAGRLLAPGAPLILYGPFTEVDVPTSESNLAFDASLKARDPRWGLRAVAALDTLASAAGLIRTRRAVMPANNLSLVWRRAP
jgi:hypothetical protein